MRVIEIKALMLKWCGMTGEKRTRLRRQTKLNARNDAEKPAWFLANCQDPFACQ